MFLALGCYMCIMQDIFDQATDMIFWKNGKDRSAADTYCKALKTLVNSTAERAATVLSYICKGHYHPRGFRKGSSTHATTNGGRQGLCPVYGR